MQSTNEWFHSWGNSILLSLSICALTTGFFLLCLPNFIFHLYYILSIPSTEGWANISCDVENLKHTFIFFFFSQRSITETVLLEHWFWLLYWKSHVLKRVLFYKIWIDQSPLSRCLYIQNLLAVQADKMWSDRDGSLCVLIFIWIWSVKLHFIPFSFL